MDLFLVTTHGPKTRLISQQPALLIRPATKSSLVDVGYYNPPPLKDPDNPFNTTRQPMRQALISNVTARPNLLDIVRFEPYRPHRFVLGDHVWPQNAYDKLATSTTKKSQPPNPHPPIWDITIHPL